MLADPLVAELLGAPLVGVFCTSEPDGVIHAVPMWFAVTDDSIALATSSLSRKVANLRLESRATLVVHDSRPGTEICGVSIRGALSKEKDPFGDAPPVTGAETTGGNVSFLDFRKRS